MGETQSWEQIRSAFPLDEELAATHRALIEADLRLARLTRGRWGGGRPQLEQALRTAEARELGGEGGRGLYLEVLTLHLAALGGRLELDRGAGGAMIARALLPEGAVELPTPEDYRQP